MFSQIAKPVRDISSSPGLIVQVGSAHYRVLGSPGSEVAPCPPLASVPQTPYWLLGVGLYKHEAIPVVHLQALLEGQARDASHATQMLVMRDACPVLGYLVNNVEADGPNSAQTHAAEQPREVLDLDLIGVGHVLMAHSFLAYLR